jgi:hypothetical protein
MIRMEATSRRVKGCNNSLETFCFEVLYRQTVRGRFELGRSFEVQAGDERL